MRTLVDIPDEFIEAIDKICKREKISRSEAIRRAVASFTETKAIAEFESALGSWKDLEIDGVEFQRKLRSEWGSSK